MDLQTFLRDTLRGKSVVVVGNAQFTKDRSKFIDSHDVVFRLNQFNREWFANGLCGKKLSFWFNNLVRDRETTSWRAQHCELARQLNPLVVVGTPYEDDKQRRLEDARKFYSSLGLELLFPDTEQPTAFLSKQPSIGFYTAFRLMEAGIAVSVIGCTGQVSKHHDGAEEIAYYRLQPPERLRLDLDF